MQKGAESAIKQKEFEKEQMEMEIAKARNIQTQEKIAETKYNIATGTCSENDIESLFEEGTINKATYFSLNETLKKTRDRVEKSNKTSLLISDAIENGEPVLNVSSAEKNRYFTEYVKSANQQREGEGKKAMTLTERVEYAKENAIVFDSNIPSLANGIATTIKNSKEAETVFDACVAIHGNETIPAIKSIDKDTKYFARIAVEQYIATGKMADIMKYRDIYFEYTDKNIENERLKSLKIDTEDLLKDAGIYTKKWGFWSAKKIPETIRASVVSDCADMLETIYAKTGSLTLARNTALKFFKEKFHDSDINGEKEPMFNPPRKENTGLEDFAIRNIVAGVCQNVIEQIEKSGETYKGNFQIKKHMDFCSTKDVSKYYKVPVTLVKDRIIDVLIGEKWEKRKLLIEASPKSKSAYSLYFQIDEKDANSKEYIVSPKSGKRYIFDFKTVLRCNKK